MNGAGSKVVCTGKIRGNLHRKKWVNVGGYVLVSEREGVCDDVVDIIDVYSSTREVNDLKRAGYIHAESSDENETEGCIVFEDDNNMFDMDDI